MPEISPLITFLRTQAIGSNVGDEAWSLLFAEARLAGVLPRVVHRIDELNLSDRISTRISANFSAALIHAAAFRRDVKRELESIATAISRIESPVLLLKGAAYMALDLPAARGRVFGDIDLLVSSEQLHLVESELMLGGWLANQLDPYDERYYREWSHEIPPMTHLHRGTTIDLHHSLVMPTCRIAVDSKKMIDAAVPIEGSKWWRLQDEDLVLHSAAHLLLNGEFDRGLRDLWDIDLLYRHFSSSSAEFSDRLMSRAREVGLEKILRQALYLARHFFSTPVPDRYAIQDPDAFLKLLKLAVSSRHPDTRVVGQSLADWVLMTREVALRLPARLLFIHLLHKVSNSFKPASQPQT